jgi:4-amino-4-deoxy-L-arabinose transferase-like glycosyltransferase
MKIRVLLSIAAILAFVTGALYIWHFHVTSYPDSESYIVPASNIVAGHGFTGPDGSPEVYRTPGYSLFLALCFAVHAGVPGAILFQHLLRILLIVGSTAFALSISQSRTVACLAGLLLVIDFPLLEAANGVLSEMLFSAVIALVYWLLWREALREPSGKWILLAGVLTGITVLIRPVSLFFFAPAIAFMAVAMPARRPRAAIIFTIGLVLLPALWAFRNYRVAGTFTVSTISAYDALIYRAAGSVAMDRPGSYWENLDPARVQICGDLRRLYSLECSPAALAKGADQFKRLAIQEIAQHPSGLLKATALGASMVPLDEGTITTSALLGRPIRKREFLIYTVPLFIFSIYGLLVCWRKNRAFFWLALWVIVYFVGVSAGPQSEARFRVPFIPLYVPLSAIGMNNLAVQMKLKK